MIDLKKKAMMRCARVARWRVKDVNRSVFLKEMNQFDRSRKTWKPDVIQRARMMNIIHDLLTEKEIFWLRGANVGARRDWEPGGKIWDKLRGVSGQS